MTEISVGMSLKKLRELSHHPSFSSSSSWNAWSHFPRIWNMYVSTGVSLGEFQTVNRKQHESPLLYLFQISFSLNEFWGFRSLTPRSPGSPEGSSSQAPWSTWRQVLSYRTRCCSRRFGSCIAWSTSTAPQIHGSMGWNSINSIAK